VGMGAIPCHASVIEWENIKKLVPKEAAEFERLVDEHGLTLAAAAISRPTADVKSGPGGPTSPEPSHEREKRCQRHTLRKSPTE